MAWFSTKVKVTFIDDATGQAFAATEMPPVDLPESFDFDTTMHLGSEDWNVIDAQPRTRLEYAKSKKLVLRLRRIEKFNSANILYSLPSICDAIPGVGNRPLVGNEFLLAEDDWRQFEFVSHSLAEDVDTELLSIRKIHESAFVQGSGWREIHVRRTPVSPLQCDLTLVDLAAALKVPATSAVGITYRGAQSQIEDGYAFITSEVNVYGIVPNGNVAVIAFDQYSAKSPQSDTIGRLKALALQLELDLVYWCRCARVLPDDRLFTQLLADDAM